MNEWTTPADIESKLRRRWVSGALLRAYALREPFDAVDVPLRGPTAADLADRFDEARRWAAALERASGDGQRFRVVTRSVGGRHLGRTEIPSRAVVESFEQAWRVLGIRGGAAGSELAIFDGLLAASRHVPAVRDWVLAHPIRALERATTGTRSSPRATGSSGTAVPACICGKLMRPESIRSCSSATAVSLRRC